MIILKAIFIFNRNCSIKTNKNPIQKPMAITYFGIFYHTIFPPCMILLFLLMFPFPQTIQKAFVGLCDAVLYLEPHPHFNISLFSLVLIISLVTLVIQVTATMEAAKLYAEVKKKGGEREEALANMLGTQRNVWISASAVCGWIILHRYRALLKKFYHLQEVKSA